MGTLEVETFEKMLGRTVTAVNGKAGDDKMTFLCSDGSWFSFYHSQDCCESVSVEEIIGDLGDLVGSPLVQAEEVSLPEPYAGGDSYTWTFYKFATAKGSVTVRWFGESNGYYSESVSYDENIAA